MTQDGPGDGRSCIEVLQDLRRSHRRVRHLDAGLLPEVEPGDGVIFLTSALIDLDNSPMLWSLRTLTALRTNRPLFVTFTQYELTYLCWLL